MTVPGNLSSPLLATAAAAAAVVVEGPIKSLRFESGDSASLARTPSSAGNRKTWTFSVWLKRGKVSSSQRTIFSGGTTQNNTGWNGLYIFQDKLMLGGWNNNFLITEQLFRDHSAWYHIVVALDTTQSSASDRLKMYVNGAQITDFSTDDRSTYITQNIDLAWNQAALHNFGKQSTGSAGYFNGYLADAYFIDGSQLDATSFGAYDDNGVWQAAPYSGTFGTNGFHLDFADGSDLGDDNSGNSNDWTPNNFSNFDGTIATASGALPILNTTDNHGGTVGSGTRTDSNSSSIVLALPMNGTNGGTTFTDQSATIKGSGSAKTITRNGDVDTVTSLSQFYGSSAEFDGTDDYLIFSHTGGLGSGDFTIEYWVYHDSLYNNITHFCNTRGSTGFNVGTNASGNFIWYDGTMGINSASAFSANRWYHCAFVRSGTTITGYLDGTSKGTYTSSTDYSASSFAIGALTNGDEEITGHMQDVRMYVGAAKYTSNFNPPSRTGGSGCDSLFDVPTNGTQSGTGAGGEVSANYPTLNPLKKANISTSNGNLDFAHSGTTGNWQVVFSTIGMTSGKYYCEFTCADADSVIGIAKDSHTIANDKYVGNDPNGWGYNGQNGQKLNNSSGSSYGNSFTSGDVIGIAFDATNGSLYFYKNGTAQNSGTAAFTGLTDGPYFFAFSIRDTGSTHSVNFGQRSFSYSAPTNYVALNTASLPTPTIADGSDYFDVKTYSGNGGEQTISGLGFSPDVVWVKRRDSAIEHILFDSVRGFGANKELTPNDTYVEGGTGLGQPNTDVWGYVDSVTSDGFVVEKGSNATGASANTTGGTYVGWVWDAGTSTVSNTDGSITSSVRANQTAGFSIVTYSGNSTSGATIGHGLNAAPEFVVVKARNIGTQGWCVYHASLGATKYIQLDTTNAASTYSGTWNDTSPTNSVFTVGNDNIVNTGYNYVAYCFAPVAGYSAFGSYEGNSNADGPFIYTGFRPRWIMYKWADGGGEWAIRDTARSTYNVSDQVLTADSGGAEQENAVWNVDILSNGFKIRTSSAGSNSSSTFIYAAFSENAFSLNGGLAR